MRGRVCGARTSRVCVCPIWTRPPSTRSGSGLVACGLLLGFLVWTGSGAVGESVADVFRFLVGGVAYLVPLFVIGAGIALAARERIESPGRLRAGAIALALGLTLGLAAGSLGLGPGGGDTRDLWGLDAMMERGGVVGESLYWATSTLFSHPGAHLVFFFLMAGGALLLTGRRIGDLIGGVRTAAVHARGRLASELEHARADAEGRTAAFEEPEGDPRIEVLLPIPSLSPTHRVAVAAEGDALDSEEDPLAQVEREIQNRAPEDHPEAVEPDPSLLTPQGARRSGVTESEGRRYRLPDPKLLRKSGKGQGPDTANQDQIAQVRWSSRWATSASRRRSSAVSPVRASRAMSCGSRPAPRSPRSRSSRTTSPMRSPRPTSASWPRSPASRPWGSRCPTSSTGWCTWATSSVATSVRRRSERFVRLTAVGVAREGHRRQLGLDGPHEDAAPAGRRHHRLGQVRLREHDAVVDPAALLPRTRSAWCWWTRSGWS